MVCINVIAADSERDARFLFTLMQQQGINLRRVRPGPLPSPVEDIEALWSPGDQYGVDQALRLSMVGGAAQVKSRLKALITETGTIELIINGKIFDRQARLRSFEITMAAREHLKD